MSNPHCHCASLWSVSCLTLTVARGKVDLGKFRQLVQPLQGVNYSKQLEDAFNTIDKEGSGFVMATELRHLLTHMGDRITDEEFNGLLEELEVDSNGRVRRKGRMMSSVTAITVGNLNTGTV